MSAKPFVTSRQAVAHGSTAEAGATEVKSVSSVSSSGPSRTSSKAPSTPLASSKSLSQQFSEKEHLPSQMSALDFVTYKHMMSTRLFGSKILPTNFFQSRASIRTWGAELTDPAVQPYDEDENLPDPFHVSLPGYPPRLCKYALQRGEKASRKAWMGPEISVSPPVWIPQWSRDPNYKIQNYGYDAADGMCYQTTRLPYINAELAPRSAEENDMYGQNYPFTAYPYGVPLC